MTSCLNLRCISDSVFSSA
uniref:Uncharacterized protein n=1 Tax=Anguilla anguilla TaxID=7936 RepID=A0A0E9S3S1_ANGAN